VCACTHVCGVCVSVYVCGCVCVYVCARMHVCVWCVCERAHVCGCVCAVSL